MIYFLSILSINLIFTGFFYATDYLFDGSIYKLQLIYPTVGLSPYSDFLYFYPPFYSILGSVGSYLKLGILGILTIITFVLSIAEYLTYKCLKKSGYSLNFLDYLAFVVLYGFSYYIIGTEPLSLMLVIALFCTLFCFNNFFSVLLLSLMLMLIRWDRYFSVTFILFFILFIEKYAHTRKSIYSKVAKNITILATVVGSALFIIWLYTGLVFQEQLNVLFYDPYLIGNARRVNHHPTSMLNTLASATFVILLIFNICALMSHFMKKEWMAVRIFLLPIALLPYAFSRHDISHFAPYILLMWLALCSKRFYVKNNIKINTTISVSAIASCCILVPIYFMHSLNIVDCSSLDSLDDSYHSVFVGAGLDTSDFYNYPVLYTKLLSLKPATKYITLEPGLTNSCDVQENIVKDILNSTPPTLVFINSENFSNQSNSLCKINVDSYVRANSDLISICRINGNIIEAKVLRNN